MSSVSAAAVAATPQTLQDAARRARLVLAAFWVLDGFLQCQPYMFTPAFGKQALAGAAQGNPRVIADPITWAAGIVAGHPGVTNALFAMVQLALGLGIAYRSTVKPALAASIVWSAAVWWLGEGFGGVFTGSATPVSGAPGAVILYAVLAVLSGQPRTMRNLPEDLGRFWPPGPSGRRRRERSGRCCGAPRRIWRCSRPTAAPRGCMT
ncbi:MAG: hypothetical protein QJR12_02450 [Mycobacterium sp.]|uniref:hypothetical protein n=1 Tax=Mycobacterium sp. TaxID=1785 RepID=UPI00262AEDD4|nr:hypothetical protein [Mycobacterium sp.]MDI3313172.1 hypothetical protein [Mycobacterium sp.]